MSAERPVDWKTASCAPDPCLICGSLAKQPLYPATYTGSMEAGGDLFPREPNCDGARADRTLPGLWVRIY